MRAMILAAGRGERLRPLTDTCPKPLIEAAGKPLILWHIEKLKAAGFTELVVNSAWLSEKIVSFLGDGARFGVHITHSVEGPGGLETAGGIIKALPFLGSGDDVFLVVNGDTFIDGDYSQFAKTPLPPDQKALLFLTSNPPHHPQGDFAISSSGSAMIRGAEYTFSGAALYRVSAFAGLPVQRLPLRPLFDAWIDEGSVSARLLAGQWFDVGTIERLHQTEDYIKALRH